MVPIQTEEMRDGNPLRICCEKYGVLPMDRKAFKGEIPLIKGMEAYNDFGFFIKRKLFIHNMRHGLCAYFGMYLRDKYNYESVNRGEILFIVQSAMKESAFALSVKYEVSVAELLS
jgi:mannitol-1-phosphate 5-dehydrogenase